MHVSEHVFERLFAFGCIYVYFVDVKVCLYMCTTQISYFVDVKALLITR